MLQITDPYDKLNNDTVYVHHLASDIRYKGIGRIMLQEIREIGKVHFKKYVRLDNIATNKKLNEYYEKNGFKQIGVVEPENYDGKNPGILRRLEI